MLGGNTWDWLLIIFILAYAFAIGIVDEDGKPTVPRILIVRSIVVMVILFLIINIGKIFDLLF